MASAPHQSDHDEQHSARSPSSQANHSQQSIELDIKSVGGDLHRVTPIFSPNNKLLACTNGHVVVLLAAATGEVIYRFEKRHQSRITCITFANDTLLYSGSLDGSIIIWDCVEMTYMRHKNLGCEIVAMSVSPRDPDLVYVALGARNPVSAQTAADATVAAAETHKSRKRKVPSFMPHDSESSHASDQQQPAAAQMISAQPTPKSGVSVTPSRKLHRRRWRIMECSLNSPSSPPPSSECMKFTAAPFFIQATPDGYVVVACPTHLVVQHIAKREMVNQITFEEERSTHIQAVAINPSKAEVATGDAMGRIFLWHTLFEKQKHVPKAPLTSKRKRRGAKLHAQHRLLRTEVRRWHAHGVTCVTYTQDGQYLLSGGEEGVLVLCQLNKSFNLNFLPRLGARLTHVTINADGSRAALTTAANSLRVLNPMNFRVAWEYKGLTYLSTSQHAVDMTAVARMWPDNSCPGRLISNTHPGRLQCFDVKSEKVIREFDVVPSNVISRTNHERLLPPWVTHMALDDMGSFMTTVEVRQGEEDVRRVSMKFWEDVNKSWRLFSVVEEPHEEAGLQGKLMAVAWWPGRQAVASCSMSGSLALWELIQEGQGRGVRRKCVCRAYVAYNHGPSRSLAFSRDGTVLAVGAGRNVVLWAPEELHLLGMLHSPKIRHTMRQTQELEVHELAFLPDTTYLATSTRRCLTLWDLCSLSPVYLYHASQVRFLCTLPSKFTLPSLRVRDRTVDFAAVFRDLEESPSRSHTGREQAVAMFSVHQAEPLLTVALPQDMQCLSAGMVGSSGSQDSNAAMRGSVYIMAKDMLCVLREQEEEEGAERGRQEAMRKAAALPGLNVQRDRMRPVPTLKQGIARPVSVAELFGTVPTCQLPQPSAIFDTVMASMLPYGPAPSLLLDEPEASPLRRPSVQRLGDIGSDQQLSSASPAQPSATVRTPLERQQQIPSAACRQQPKDTGYVAIRQDLLQRMTERLEDLWPEERIESTARVELEEPTASAKILKSDDGQGGGERSGMDGQVEETVRTNGPLGALLVPEDLSKVNDIPEVMRTEHISDVKRAVQNGDRRAMKRAQKESRKKHEEAVAEEGENGIVFMGPKGNLWSEAMANGSHIECKKRRRQRENGDVGIMMPSQVSMSVSNTSEVIPNGRPSFGKKAMRKKSQIHGP